MGKTTRVKINRDRLCVHCEGRGGEIKHNQKCTACLGTGKIKKVAFMGPGNYKEGFTSCDICHGAGETIPEGNKCNECKGAKVKKEKKVIECVVDKGSPDGE